MKYFDRIENKLIKEFAPSDLEVIDESDLHAGHSGAKPGGETHFRVRMTSKSFVGMSRIDRQRAVHKALKDELEVVVSSRWLPLAL